MYVCECACAYVDERVEEDEGKGVRDIVHMCEHKEEQQYFSYRVCKVCVYTYGVQHCA